MADQTYVVAFRDDGTAIVSRNIKKIGSNAAAASKSLRSLRKTIAGISRGVKFGAINSQVAELSLNFKQLITVMREVSMTSRSIGENIAASVTRSDVAIDQNENSMKMLAVAISALVGEIKQLVLQMRQVNNSVNLVSDDIDHQTNVMRELASANDRIQVEIRQTGAAMNRTEKSTRRVTRSFVGLRSILATLGTFLSVREVIRYSDAWTSLSNKIRIVTKDEKDLTKVRKELIKVSKQTFSSIEGNVTLFQRLSLANKNLGKSQEELIAFTKTISETLAISGATAEETRSVLIQLSQGLGSVAVRGDEFRSVMEAAPRAMKALQDATGLTVGQLKELTAQGKFLSKDFFEAIASQSDAITADFKNISRTFSQSMAIMKTNMTEFFGRIEEATGTISALGNALVALTEKLKDMVPAIIDFSSKWNVAMTKMARDFDDVRFRIDNFKMNRSEEELADFTSKFAQHSSIWDGIIDSVRAKVGDGVFDPTSELIFPDFNAEDELIPLAGIDAAIDKFKQLREAMNPQTFFGGIKEGFQQMSLEVMNFGEIISDLTQNTIRSFSDGLTEALTGGEADFKALARTAINQLISIMIQALITQAVLGAIGGLGGGGLGAGLAGAIGGNQFGGQVQAGVPTVVGERRPEIFVPQSAGRIIPNPEAGGGESQAPTIVNVVDQQQFYDALASTTGQKIITNVISRNRKSLRI